MNPRPRDTILNRQILKVKSTRVLLALARQLALPFSSRVWTGIVPWKISGKRLANAGRRGGEVYAGDVDLH